MLSFSMLHDILCMHSVQHLASSYTLEFSNARKEHCLEVTFAITCQCVLGTQTDENRCPPLLYTTRQNNHLYARLAQIILHLQKL